MTLKREGVTKGVDEQMHIHPKILGLQSGTMNVPIGPTLSGLTNQLRLMAGLSMPKSGFWSSFWLVVKPLPLSFVFPFLLHVGDTR